MNISTRVRVLMALNGDTATTMADKIGVSADTIYRAIRRNSKITHDTMIMIADGYGVTVNWLENGVVKLEVE